MATMIGSTLTLDLGTLRWNPFEFSKVVLSYKILMSSKVVVTWTIFHVREVVWGLHIRCFVEDEGSKFHD